MNQHSIDGSQSPAERYERDQIAEVASLGVRFHLCREDLICAVRLQEFAALAWAPPDEVSDEELRMAAEGTLGQLEHVVDAGAARSFLRAAIESLGGYGDGAGG